MPRNAPMVPRTVPEIFESPALGRNDVSIQEMRAPRRCAFTTISVVQA